MCGIIGSIGNKAEDFVKNGLELINHRGPDATGLFIEDNFAFGHKRLSILDLSSNSNQPIITDEKIICFNGEIYNYRQLSKKYFNYEFPSDTLFLKRYLTEKTVEDLVKEASGMFAISVYNLSTRTLELTRDRFGEKPLFYSIVGSSIYFASEIKPIEVFLSSENNLNVCDQSLKEILLFNSSRSNSVFKEILSLIPGTVLSFKKDKKTISNNMGNKIKKSNNDFFKTFDGVIEDIVNTDTKIGILLSGGIDSSSIAYVAHKHRPDITAYTLAFENKEYDESSKAIKFAETLGIEHKIIQVNLDDLTSELEFWLEKNPLFIADPGVISLSLVARKVKEDGVKVLLGGDGGDELFGGYNRHTYFKQYKSKTIQFFSKLFLKSDFNLKLNKSLNKLSILINQQDDFNFYNNIWGNKPINCGFYLKEWNNWSPREQDLDWYLPNNILVKTDRVLMTHSIEGRLPFLDSRLLKFQDLKDDNKIHLRKLLEESSFDFTDYTKKGFGIPISEVLYNRKLDIKGACEFLEKRLGVKGLNQSYNLWTQGIDYAYLMYSALVVSKILKLIEK